jgi:hypothetical protein
MGVYVEVVLEFANIVITLFALIYGLFFIVHTARHQHKMPWVYLTVGSVLFLINQCLSLAQNFGFRGEHVALTQTFVGTGFASMILLAFISEVDIILKSSYILIQKKGEKIKPKTTQNKRKV